MDASLIRSPEQKVYNTFPDYGRRDSCVEDLIVLNAINTAQGNTISAIADGTRDAVKETADGTRTTTKAAYDAGLAAVEAANRNGIAAIKETSDASRDNIRETSRAGSDNIRETSRVGSDLASQLSEARLAMAIADGLIRKDIADSSRDNLIAIKDNGFAIREEGSRTREKLCEVEHNLEKSIFAVEKETLKGFHQTQLEALKNKCELEAKIDAICCCVDKDGAATRALIEANANKVLERENSDLRWKIALQHNHHKD